MRPDKMNKAWEAFHSEMQPLYDAIVSHAQEYVVALQKAAEAGDYDAIDTLTKDHLAYIDFVQSEELRCISEVKVAMDAYEESIADYIAEEDRRAEKEAEKVNGRDKSQNTSPTSNTNITGSPTIDNFEVLPHIGAAGEKKLHDASILTYTDLANNREQVTKLLRLSAEKYDAIILFLKKLGKV